VYDILDAQLVASIAFGNAGDAAFATPGDDAAAYPTVLPVGYVRDGDSLLFHGKSSSLLQKRLASGTPVCVSIFSLDAIVCAKAAMHHSVNYRAVVVYGRATSVTDADDKRRALDLITDGLTWHGRAAACRPMTDAEIKATLVTRLALEDGNVSCKVRAHPASDDAEDADYPTWAGNVPLRTVSLRPVNAPHNNFGVKPPPQALALKRSGDPPVVTPLRVLAKAELGPGAVSALKHPDTAAMLCWRAVAIVLGAVLAFMLFASGDLQGDLLTQPTEG